MITAMWAAGPHRGHTADLRDDLQVIAVRETLAEAEAWPVRMIALADRRWWLICPPGMDATEAILALIDADPADAARVRAD